MALTPSNMLPIGTAAPNFKLPDVVTGLDVAWNDISSDVGTVVMFICNHCPYVIHVHDEMLKVANDYQPQGLSFVAISSNDVESYPADGPEEMKALAKSLKFSFPYLYDETQEVARAYEAACTPDFYVFDKDDQLLYRGRLDGSSPGNGVPLTGADLRNALDKVKAGLPVDGKQFPSMGCNIKWK